MLKVREIGFLKKPVGLTLLESLSALVVVVILTAMAVPSFMTFLQERRLTLTAENLLYALETARSEAIKRNTSVYVSFQTGDNWCYGINTGSNCSCSTPSSCNLGAVSASASQQISLSTTGITSSNFQFEGSRGASNVNNALVTLTLYGQTTSISVLIPILGNLQLCSSMSGYGACP